MQPEDITDLQAFLDEFDRETDRGLALVGAAVIDDKPAQTLKAFFRDHAKLVDRILDPLKQGPLGAFAARADVALALGLLDEVEHVEISAKILMGQALDLFGSETSRNLTYIRHIRNAFAHSKKPITFKTPEVKAACDLLVTQKVVHPHTVPKKGERPDRLIGRKRYQRACEVISHNLIWHSLRLLDHKGISRGALKPEITLDERLELRLMPKPLP